MDKFVFFTPDNDAKIAGLYNLQHTIGCGHYAVVKLAYHVFTGEKVAVKVIDKTKLDGMSQEQLFKEVVCMKLVQHPYVVRLYEVIDTPNKLYLILELGDGGDLYDFITKHGRGLEERIAKRYFRQIVTAIAYCHKLHIVHRDLKPENVVFFEQLGLVKLTDFGFSNKFSPGSLLDTACGSLAYSAPEILLGNPYNAPNVDIWSLGVILFMLVCGKLPFNEPNDSETLTKILDCDYVIPEHVSPSCCQLIRRLLVREPHLRYSLDEILQDDWLHLDEINLSLALFSVPLVSRDCLSFEDHMEILTKMSDGQLASVDEIQAILDRNEYNHIAATYFLLAERKLKRNYFEQYKRLKQAEAQQRLDLAQSIVEKPVVNGSTVMCTCTTDGTNPGEAALLPPQQQLRYLAPTPLTDDRVRRFSMILEDAEEDEENEFEVKPRKLFQYKRHSFIDDEEEVESNKKKNLAVPEIDELENDNAIEEEEEEEEMNAVASLAFVRSDCVTVGQNDELRTFRSTSTMFNLSTSARCLFGRPNSHIGGSVSDGTESDVSVEPPVRTKGQLARQLTVGGESSVRPASAYRASLRRSIGGMIAPHRPLVSVRSTPHLLEHIVEQDEWKSSNGLSKVSAPPSRQSSELRHRQFNQRQRYLQDINRYTLSNRPLTAYPSLNFMDDQMFYSRSRHSSPRSSTIPTRQFSVTHSPTRTRRFFATHSRPSSRPQSMISWKTARKMSLLADLRRQSMCSSPADTINSTCTASYHRKPLVQSSSYYTADRRRSGPPSLTSPFSGFPLSVQPTSSSSRNSSITTSTFLPIRSESTHDISSNVNLLTLKDNPVSIGETPVHNSDSSSTSRPHTLRPFGSNGDEVKTIGIEKPGSSYPIGTQSQRTSKSTMPQSNVPHTLQSGWRSSAPLLCDLESYMDLNFVPGSSNHHHQTIAPSKDMLCTTIREEEDDPLRFVNDTNYYQPFEARRQSDSLTRLHSSTCKYHLTTSNTIGNNKKEQRNSQPGPTFIDTDSESSTNQAPQIHHTSPALLNLSCSSSCHPRTALTNSSFSLASIGTSVSESRRMCDILRGTFELQSYYNRLGGGNGLQQRPISAFTGVRSTDLVVSSSTSTHSLTTATSRQSFAQQLDPGSVAAYNQHYSTRFSRPSRNSDGSLRALTAPRRSSSANRQPFSPSRRLVARNSSTTVSTPDRLSANLILDLSGPASSNGIHHFTSAVVEPIDEHSEIGTPDLSTSPTALANNLSSSSYLNCSGVTSTVRRFSLTHNKFTRSTALHLGSCFKRRPQSVSASTTTPNNSPVTSTANCVAATAANHVTCRQFKPPRVNSCCSIS